MMDPSDNPGECKESPHCDTCPLPICKYDDPDAYRHLEQYRHSVRENLIAIGQIGGFSKAYIRNAKLSVKKRNGWAPVRRGRNLPRQVFALVATGNYTYYRVMKMLDLGNTKMVQTLVARYRKERGMPSLPSGINVTKLGELRKGRFYLGVCVLPEVPWLRSYSQLGKRGTSFVAGKGI